MPPRFSPYSLEYELLESKDFFCLVCSLLCSEYCLKKKKEKKKKGKIMYSKLFNEYLLNEKKSLVGLFVYLFFGLGW